MVAVIIGAGRGIGRTLAEKFLREGHKTVVGLRSFPGDPGWDHYPENKILVLRSDVRDESSLRRAAEQTAEKFGEIDIVVDAAGILLPGDEMNDLLHEDPDEIRAMFDVNALGIILAFRSFYPHMSRNIGSIFAAITAEGGTLLQQDTIFPAYVISKAAANKAVQILHNTVSDIQVIAIHPGRVNTDMGRKTAQIEPEESAQGLYRILTGNQPVPHWFLNYTGEALPIG